MGILEMDFERILEATFLCVVITSSSSIKDKDIFIHDILYVVSRTENIFADFSTLVTTKF